MESNDYYANPHAKTEEEVLVHLNPIPSNGPAGKRRNSGLEITMGLRPRHYKVCVMVTSSVLVVALVLLVGLHGQIMVARDFDHALIRTVHKKLDDKISLKANKTRMVGRDSHGHFLMRNAFRAAELEFGLTFEDARAQLQKLCLDLARSGYQQKQNEYLKGPGMEASQFILRAIELQLIKKNPHTAISSWVAQSEEMVRSGDNHNGCVAMCGLSNYALLSFPLRCPNGTTPDEYGCESHRSTPDPGAQVDADPKLVLSTIYTGGREMQKGMCGMLRSACYQKIPMHLLHTDHWAGLGTKVEMLLRFVEYQANLGGKRKIIMFVDAYDTLMQVDSDTIVQRFLATGANVILSTEDNSFPLNQDFCDLHLGYYVSRLFTAGTRKFVNTGGIIGYADSIRDILRPVFDFIPSDYLAIWPGTDQGMWTHIFLQNHPGLITDTESQFWATFAMHSTPAYKKADDSYHGWGPRGKDGSAPKHTSAALHMNTHEGTMCFSVMEDLAPYNSDRDHSEGIGSGECGNDTNIETLIYQFSPGPDGTNQYTAPTKQFNFYQNACSKFQCECWSCECERHDNLAHTCREL